MLRTSVWYDPTKSAQFIQVHNDEGQFVIDYLTDEYLSAVENIRYVKEALLEGLCCRWQAEYGTEIEFVQVEGAELIVRYKDDGVQVSGEEEIRQDPPVDRVPATETTRDVVRDPSD